jgi:hypothetical protein
MQRNINNRGRIARAITGLVTIAFGLFMLAYGWPPSQTWRWLLAVLAFAAGAFQLFEAARGWCVARACGIKTPM